VLIFRFFKTFFVAKYIGTSSSSLKVDSCQPAVCPADWQETIMVKDALDKKLLVYTYRYIDGSSKSTIYIYAQYAELKSAN